MMSWLVNQLLTAIRSYRIFENKIFRCDGNFDGNLRNGILKMYEMRLCFFFTLDVAISESYSECIVAFLQNSECILISSAIKIFETFSYKNLIHFKDCADILFCLLHIFQFWNALYDISNSSKFIRIIKNKLTFDLWANFDLKNFDAWNFLNDIITF